MIVLRLLEKKHFPLFDQIEGEVLIQRHGIIICRHNSQDEAHAWFSHIKAQEKEGQTLILPFQPNQVLVRKASNDKRHAITQIKKTKRSYPWFSCIG